MSILSSIFNRSGVMDKREVELRCEYQRHSTAKLREIRGCRRDGLPESAVLDQMLHEREFWQRFWTSGIVAWVSLAVAIAAFIVSLTRHTR